MNARSALNLTMFFASASPGAYYIYRDSKGGLVISNQTPPPGSKIIKQQSHLELADSSTATPERKPRSKGDNANAKSHKNE